MVKKTEGEKKGLVESVVNREAWTAEEDRKLVECVRIHGHKKWRTLPAKAGLNRCGRSCRLRWLNYLRPGIKKGDITEEEEDLIIRLHNLLGNRWSLIAGRLPGRTDNEIKNHWNTHLRKRSLTIDDLNLKLNQKKESSRGLTCTPLASSHGFGTMMDPIEDWILDGAAEPLQLPPKLHFSEIGTAPEQLFDVMPNPNGNGTGGSTGRGEFGFEGHGSRGQDGYQDLLVGDITGTNSSEGCSSSHALAVWDAPQFDDLGRFIAFENVDSYFLN